METELIQIMLQSGTAGAVAIAAGWYILQKDKSHKEERKEFLQQLAKQADEQREQDKSQQQEFIKLLQDSTSKNEQVLAGINELKTHLSK